MSFWFEFDLKGTRRNMTEELFDKWIKELRSDLKKTIGAQYDEREEAFCALGVLGKVAYGTEHTRPIWPNHTKPWRKEWKNLGALLYGLKVGEKDLELEIVHMNDSLGLSFSKIADFLESHRDQFFPKEGMSARRG